MLNYLLYLCRMTFLSFFSVDKNVLTTFQQLWMNTKKGFSIHRPKFFTFLIFQFLFWKLFLFKFNSKEFFSAGSLSTRSESVSSFGCVSTTKGLGLSLDPERRRIYTIRICEMKLLRRDYI